MHRLQYGSPKAEQRHMKVDLVVATIRIASTVAFGASVDHERRSSRGIVDKLKLEFNIYVH